LGRPGKGSLPPTWMLRGSKACSGKAGTGNSKPEERLERSREMNGFPERILLATDGLENTTPAARAAVDLAKKGGAELHVVHVWHTVPSPHFDRVIRREGPSPRRASGKGGQSRRLSPRRRRSGRGS
jgi:Universal stress protein family